jgi:hypothetical protein
MKHSLFIIVLLGVPVFVGSANAENSVAENAAQILEHSEYITKAVASIDGSALTVKLRPTIVERRLVHVIRKELAAMADAVDVAMIHLEIYDGQMPLFRISLDRDRALALKTIPDGRMDWLSQLSMTDIRPIERVVADDLQVFSASVRSVKVADDETTVLLRYQGAPASLVETFVAMILTVVEDTPWVKDVTFIFAGEGDARQQLSVSVENFLALLKEQKSPVEFFESIAHGEVPAIARNEIAASSDAPAARTSEKEIDAVTPQPEPSSPSNIIVSVVVGVAVAVLLGVFLFIRMGRKK